MPTGRRPAPVDPSAETRNSSLSSILRVWDSESADPATVAHSFRRFLCLKVGFVLVLIAWSNSLVLGLAVGAVALVASRRRHYLAALIVLFVLAAARAAAEFPYTINHVGLEVYLLLLMIVLSSSASNPETSVRVSQHLLRVMKVSLLSVWFYSGVQKVVQGYYHTGEIFFFHQTPRGGLTDDALSVLRGVLPTSMPALQDLTPAVDCFIFMQLPVSNVFIAFLAWLGTAIVVAEISLPMLALRFPRGGAVALAILHILIAVATWEWDFAFVGLACLLVFLPEEAPGGHVILLTLFAGYEVLSWWSYP